MLISNDFIYMVRECRVGIVGGVSLIISVELTLSIEFYNCYVHIKIYKFIITDCKSIS